jgi:hypothetical protein
MIFVIAASPLIATAASFARAPERLYARRTGSPTPRRRRSPSR